MTRSFLRTIVEGYHADGAQLELNYKGFHPTNSFGTNGGSPRKQIPLTIPKQQVGELDLGARRHERASETKDIKVISDAANILAEEILVSTMTLDPHATIK